MSTINYKYSFYPKDKVLDWTPGDSSKLFEENIIKYTLEDKSIKYYTENPIEYSYNNYGFRTPDDFNTTDEGNVFLGCSVTMGTGHHLKNTWAYKVNKEVGGKFWNLSQGGCGIQTDYRLLLGWKDTLKIKNIFHFTYPHPRFEFFHNGNILQLNNWEDSIDISFKKFFQEVLSIDEYCKYIQQTYSNAIKGLSQDIGCNYYHLTGKIFKKYDKSRDDSLTPRDLKHPTVGQQNFIYEKFKEKYNE